jgi:hypothetical protein
MEWGTLAGIVLGAILGSGSTLAVDWIQARRNIDQQWLEARRQVYARFLVALAQAHSRMAVAAFNGLPGEERRQAVHEAFHSDPQNCDAKSVIRELAITAPHEVFQPALDVYNVLRDLRDVLAHSSFAADSPKYRASREPFFTQLAALQDVMRADLWLTGLRPRRYEQPTPQAELAAEPATELGDTLKDPPAGPLQDPLAAQD